MSALPRTPLSPLFFTCVALLVLLEAVVRAPLHKAQAQAATSEPTWSIEVAPGSECASSPDFVRVLTEKIPERQRASATSAELIARVFVGKDRSASVVVLDPQLTREAGRREMTLAQPGCVAAAETLAFVIAVMVEAGRAAFPAPGDTPPVPPPPPPPPPEEPTPHPEPASERPRYVRPERHAWQGPPAGHDVTLSAGTNIGLLPGWSIGGNLGWGIRGHKLWPVWMTGTGWLNQLSDDHRARIGAAYAGLMICPLHWGRNRVRIRLCPGFSLGAMWAEGRRRPVDRRKVSTLTLGVVDGGFHVRLAGPLELILVARLEVPLMRLKFVYYRSDGSVPEVHHTAPVAGSFFGGLGLRFR